MASNRDKFGRPEAEYPGTSPGSTTGSTIGKNASKYTNDEDMIDPIYKVSSDPSFDRVSGSTGKSSSMTGASAIDTNPAYPRPSIYTTSGSTYARYGDRFVTGLFHSRDDAEKAWKELTTRHGLTSENITVLMTDETRNRHFKSDQLKNGNLKKDVSEARGMDRDTKVLEGTGVGGAIGGTLGAIVGGIAAIGTNLLIPGLGIVVAGPIAAALAGAGAGGAVGGLIGALAGAGIPEDRAKEYEKSLKSGGIMVGAHVKGDAQAMEVEKTLRRFGADRVEG